MTERNWYRVAVLLLGLVSSLLNWKHHYIAGWLIYVLMLCVAWRMLGLTPTPEDHDE